MRRDSAPDGGRWSLLCLVVSSSLLCAPSVAAVGEDEDRDADVAAEADGGLLALYAVIVTGGSLLIGALSAGLMTCACGVTLYTLGFGGVFGLPCLAIAIAAPIAGYPAAIVVGDSFGADSLGDALWWPSLLASFLTGLLTGLSVPVAAVAGALAFRQPLAALLALPVDSMQYGNQALVGTLGAAIGAAAVAAIGCSANVAIGLLMQPPAGTREPRVSTVPPPRPLGATAMAY